MRENILKYKYSFFYLVFLTPIKIQIIVFWIFDTMHLRRKYENINSTFRLEFWHYTESIEIETYQKRINVTLVLGTTLNFVIYCENSVRPTDTLK